MKQLHSSLVVSHGFLTSVVCLIGQSFTFSQIFKVYFRSENQLFLKNRSFVDSRLSVKVSDYGITKLRDQHELLAVKEGDTDRQSQPLLWRAPELLRVDMPPKGSQVLSKNNIFSYFLQKSIPFGFCRKVMSTVSPSLCSRSYCVVDHTNQPIWIPVIKSSTPLSTWSLR
jgi:hypothetical protein